ncbi:MAG: hypothetical protein KGN34_16160 [Sphingomonadales bacterium]|nr:hypothetical protein [Sphingomonadales bacterium]
MIATILGIAITGLFGGAAAFAAGSIVLTDRRHAGAWDALAAERRRLKQQDEAAQNTAWPCLVSTRLPAEPAGPVAYQRRFNPRATGLPLRVSPRAAA